MNMQSEESGFYDVTGSEPRPISKAEALGEGDEAAAVEATEGDTPEETDTAAESDGSDEVFGRKVDTLVENLDAGMTVAEAVDATNDKGLYGGTIEEVSRAIAAEHGLELMSQRLRKELLRKLTVEELAERGQDAARIRTELEGVEDDKRAANASYNARIKDLREQISALDKPIIAGADEVLIDCCMCADFRFTKTVQVFRLDTRQRIETRAMTVQEIQRLAQQPLPFDAAAEVRARANLAENLDLLDAAEPDPNAPPEIEQGQRLAAMRPDPAELSATGLVTAGCAENATYIGPLHTEDGQRFAAYKLDGGNRHAFVPWPEPEGIGDIEAVDAETSDEGAPDDEAAVLDAELGDYSFDDDDETDAEPPPAERWRGTDPALVEKARTNLTGVTPAVPK